MVPNIFNRTRIDDAVRRPVLAIAKRLAGANGGVVVKIDARVNRPSYAKSIAAPRIARHQRAMRNQEGAA